MDTIGPPEGKQLRVTAVGHHGRTNLAQRQVAERQAVL
jgi:hypothetical protein